MRRQSSSWSRFASAPCSASADAQPRNGAMSAGWCASLGADGIGAGDHVGLQLLNGAEYLEGMLAAFKLRAVPVNVNYRYVERELAYLYDNADLAGLVVHRRFAPVVAAVLADRDRPEHVFV